MAKTTNDYEAEGYRVHTWYLADCPYTQPKIRDAWQRGAWKWQQEQRALRPGASPAHATRAKIGPAPRGCMRLALCDLRPIASSAGSIATRSTTSRRRVQKPRGGG